MTTKQEKLEYAQERVRIAENNLRSAKEHLQLVENIIPFELELIAEKADSYDFESYKISVGPNGDSLVFERKSRTDGEVITPGSNVFKILFENRYRVEFIGANSTTDKLVIYVRKF